MRTPIPLSGWADSELRVLAALSETEMPSGEQLLGERASLNGFTVPGLVSAGGGGLPPQPTVNRVKMPQTRASEGATGPYRHGDFRPSPAFSGRCRGALHAIEGRHVPLGLATLHL